MSIGTAQHDASIPPGTLVRFTRPVTVVDAERSGAFVWHYVEMGEIALIINSPEHANKDVRVRLLLANGTVAWLAFHDYDLNLTMPRALEPV